jgi:hypothetical protein
LWASIIVELYASKALNLTQRKLKFVQVHPAHRRSIFLAPAEKKSVLYRFFFTRAKLKTEKSK